MRLRCPNTPRPVSIFPGECLSLRSALRESCHPQRETYRTAQRGVIIHPQCSLRGVPHVESERHGQKRSRRKDHADGD